MEFKVVNLNVWLGGKLMPQILKFISQENPDILNLQEARRSRDPKGSNQTELIFKKELGLPYSAFAPAFFDTLENCDNGNLILSKHPILDSKTIFLNGNYSDYTHGQDPKYFSKLPRNMIFSRINLNGKIINVFNLQGIWGYKDGSDNNLRLKMSQIIVNQIKSLENVLLTGDFNCQEGTKTINNIEKYLINIFKGERKSTFNMKQKSDPGYAVAIVDFIFASKNLNLISKSMPAVDISDHLPLVATFAL